MPDKAKRRFHSVDVEEVSLVGSPANETPFYVVKHKEKEQMGASAQEGGTQTVSLAHNTEAAGAAVTECLKSMESIIGKVITLSKGQPVEAEASEESDDTEATETEETLLTKAGVSAEVAKSTLALLAKAGIKLAKSGEAKVTKQEPATSAATDDQPDPAVEALLSTITKAHRLTPSRIAALSQAADLLKVVLEGVATGQSPATKTPKGTVPGSGIQSQLSKSAENPELVAALQELGVGLQKSLTPLLETIKGLQAKVDAIESAKPASESQDAGNTDRKVSKGASIFAGVI